MQSLYQFISIQPSVLLQLKKKGKFGKPRSQLIIMHTCSICLSASDVLFYSISAVNSMFELAVEIYSDERCIFLNLATNPTEARICSVDGVALCIVRESMWEECARGKFKISRGNKSLDESMARTQWFARFIYFSSSSIN